MFPLIFLALLLISIKSSTSCPECVYLSTRYQEHMNPDVKPCDNFYEFACGNYKTKHQIRKYEQYRTILEEIQSHIHDQIKRIFQEDALSPTVAKAKKYYENCLDEASKKEHNDELLRKQIENFRGWKMLNNRTEDLGSWEILARNFTLHGFHYLFTPKITKGIIKLEGPTFSIGNHWTYYSALATNQNLQNSYKNMVSEIFKLLGIPVENKSFLDDLIKFELRLGFHRIMPIVMTFEELKTNYSFINWDEYFNEELRNDLGSFDKIEVTVKLDLIKDLVENVNTTLKIRDFLMWRFTKDMLSFMSEKYQKPGIEFSEKEFGKHSNFSTNDSCLIETRQKFDVPLAAEILTKNFKKTTIEKMIENIKNAMKTQLENVVWMNEETKKKALKKLEKMKQQVGYPEYLKENLTAYFKGFKLVDGEFLTNAIELSKLKRKEDLKKQSNWKTLLEVDAFYDPFINTFIIGSVISMYPMFIENAPIPINYGSFGHTIGHEITHGFDKLGMQFDENGEFQSWDMGSLSNFTNCLSEQYFEEHTGINKFMFKMLKDGEAFADNSGLRIAFKAFRKIADGQHDFPNMTEYSNDQLFFIAFANNLCMAQKDSSKAHLLTTDPHTIGSARVNIPLQNFDKFAEAFKCDSGSAMNRKDKCVIW